MAKFIHLSLLLAATAQLPVVSVTKIFIPNGKKVTFKFPSDWTVDYCCRDNRCKFVEEDGKFQIVSVNAHELFIHNNNQLSNGNYSCYGVSDPPTHTDLLLCLKITGCKGPQSSKCDVKIFDGVPHHSEDDRCKGICLNFGETTFNPIINCPQSSCNHVKIQLNNPSLSGDCLSNSYSEDANESAAELQFYGEAKSWIDALEHCQNHNTSLVQITSDTEQNRVNSFLQTKRKSMEKGAWIGLERSIFGKNDIPWKWISGSVVGDHAPWNKSFPVDALNHHCGKIIWVEELQNWLDAWCHELLPFICQSNQI